MVKTPSPQDTKMNLIKCIISILVSDIMNLYIDFIKKILFKNSNAVIHY